MSFLPSELSDIVSLLLLMSINMQPSELMAANGNCRQHCRHEKDHWRQKNAASS